MVTIIFNYIDCIKVYLMKQYKGIIGLKYGKN
jgi:hypothetical protein